MKNKIAKVRAPKGFNFQIYVPTDTWSLRGNGRKYKNKVIPNYVKLYLVQVASGRRVGSITLEYYSPGSYETHSSLDPEFHGKGIGTIMYARAIQWCLENGYKARSSSSPSELAQRVWNGKGIRKIYRLRRRESRWGDTMWHAYSK